VRFFFRLLAWGPKVSAVLQVLAGAMILITHAGAGGE
jgi:hypothetical protein